MNSREIFETIGAFASQSFKVLPPIGAVVNYSFMLIIAGLLAYWLLVMGKEQKGKPTDGLYPYLKK